MKELDKMKELWKEVHETNNDYTQLNKEQIMESLSKKSNSVFSKLQLSVKLEFIVSGITLPLILLAGFYYKTTEYYIFSLTFTMLGVMLMAFLWKDLKKIYNYVSDKQSLREKLTDSINHLEQFKEMYFKVYMFLWPLVGLAYYLLYRLMERNTTTNSFDIKILIAMMIGSTVAGYFIQRWYTEYMYGKHIDRLKDLRNELENEG
jgi:hypothetical protein